MARFRSRRISLSNQNTPPHPHKHTHTTHTHTHTRTHLSLLLLTGPMQFLCCRFVLLLMQLVLYNFWLFRYLLSLQKTRLFKYIENFSSKNWNFSDKNSDIFQVSAQNIDCAYSLEPPRWGGSNQYLPSMFLSRNKKKIVYPCKPQFYYTKVGFKGFKII